MGGIWVDYELQTTVPGLFATGESNFSDHGANRLGASALMQGLADGYFVLPYTIQNYLADEINTPRFSTDGQEFDAAEKEVRDQLEKLMAVKGNQSVDTIHKRLGRIMWDYVGMARNKEGLELAVEEIRNLREEFWNSVKIPGELNDLNPELQKASRLADFLELGELMARDALHREESCGGHFREEYQTGEGEALRNDADFTYVAAWEYKGPDKEPFLNKEPLKFENIEVKQRNYK
jgi:succinate dehydrogenase / fumarate reductase flavoprotein subunit